MISFYHMEISKESLFFVLQRIQSEIISFPQLVIDSNVSFFKESSYFDIFKHLLFMYFFVNWLLKCTDYILGYGLFRSIGMLLKSIAQQFYKKLLQLPPLKKRVEAEIKDTVKSLEEELIVKSPLSEFNSIPERGLSAQEVLTKLDDLNTLHASDWKAGRLSGAVYHGGEELIDLQTKAFQKYAVSNQLHPDCFPGLRQMESEVVSMVLKLFNAPEETGCGTTTSGGTESLLLACLAARERARAEKGITEPEIIAPVTVHAAVFKAAKYFKINLKLADLNEDYKVDVKQVKRLITRNTCLLVGSAPNFPHGIVDDIQSLSELAVKHDIPLHVDCCLGSFVIAYYSRTFPNEELPAFDFRAPGVGAYAF